MKWMKQLVLGFASLALVLGVTAMAEAQVTAAGPTIGPSTPCTLSWAMPPSYTGTIDQFAIYLDPPATGVVPGTTVPNATLSGPQLFPDPHTFNVWGICKNIPNISAGPHSITVAPHNQAGWGPAIAPAPFVFAGSPPPAVIWSPAGPVQ